MTDICISVLKHIVLESLIILFMHFNIFCIRTYFLFCLHIFLKIDLYMGFFLKLLFKIALILQVLSSQNYTLYMLYVMRVYYEYLTENELYT